MTRQLKNMEAHSGQNYLINVMLHLSNFKVFVIIFMLCARRDNSHRLGYGMCHFLRVLFRLKNKFLGLFYSFIIKFLGQDFSLE